MQEVRQMAKYEIVIKNETDTDKSSPIAGNTAQGKTAGKTDEKSVNTTALKGLMAAKSIAVSVIDQTVSHEISTVSLRTGANEQQDRLSFAYSVGKQVGSAVMSLAVGAAVGGLPGAIIGLTTSLISTAVTYSNKAADIQMQHDLEGVGLRYANARSGGAVSSFSGSRQNRQ